MGPLTRLTLVLLALVPGTVVRQELPRGVVLDDVKCLQEPAQSYALYLPSGYTPDRRWSVLVGFHPGGRGRAIVEKYRAAAEQYGYIVAASNNSRNGPWSVSVAAVRAMFPDIGNRFAIDDQRIYLTGHSGGARVAMQVALNNTSIAGVIASSGGYPDSQPRSKVPFAVFGTAGDEDFNYIEMRMLDRKLTSAHRLTVFQGGHTLPPDPVALEAIEWMELHAMRSGRRPKDDTLIDRLLDRRRQQVTGSTGGADTLHLLEGLIADFDGLRDVSAETQRVRQLSSSRDVKDALARERAADDREARTIAEFAALEADLADDGRRADALVRLREHLTQLATRAAAEEDSPERSRARRVLRTVTAGASERVSDPEYRAILDKARNSAR